MLRTDLPRIITETVPGPKALCNLCDGGSRKGIFRRQPRHNLRWASGMLCSSAGGGK